MTALTSPRRWLTPLHVALLTTTTLIVAAVWSVSQHAAPVDSRPGLSDRAFSEAVSALSEPAAFPLASLWQ